MPKLEDIEKFKAQINSLGNEIEYLAERGESIVDIPPPEQGVPDDISALLDGISDDVSSDEGEVSSDDEDFTAFDDQETAPDAEFDDLGDISDLGDMFEDTGDEFESDLMPDDLVAAEPISEDEPTGPDEPDSFDLSEDLDAFEEPGEAESFDLPEDLDAFEEPGEAESFDLPEDLDAFEEPGEAESFDLPEDLDAFEETGEAESFDLPEDLDAFEETGEAESFDLPEDLDAFEEPGEAESFDLPEDLDAFEEPGEAESFDLPEDLDAFEETGEAESFDLPEDLDAFEETGEAESFDLPEDLDAFEEPEGTESFDLPEDALEPLEDLEIIDDEDTGDFDIGSLDDISLEDDFETPSGTQSEEGDEFEIVDGSETEIDMGTDEFSLDDLGEEYSTLEDIADFASAPAAGEEVSYRVPEQEETASDFSIERQKLEKVTDTLNRLPRNLKFIVEDLIGNKGLAGKRLDLLVNKLATDASVREIAELAGKILGKRIRIPSQYERKTWEELEEEKQTFSYILKHRILPLCRKGRIILSRFIFYRICIEETRFMIRFIHHTCITKGMSCLKTGNTGTQTGCLQRQAESSHTKKQFYRYAEGYIEKREYGRAESKYITLLGAGLSSEREKARKEMEKGFFPTDKKGFLDYATLKTYYQGQYAKSDRILEDFILQKGNKWDYEALIDRLDNFLNWAEEEPEYFDSAEYILNDSLSKFGSKPELMFRKIAYYIRSGRIDELENAALRDIGLGKDRSIDINKYYGLVSEFNNYIKTIKEKYLDPFIATDFYRYMIDHDKIDGLEPELIRISNLDKNLPEPHFQLSRFWNRLEKNELELRALENIEKIFEKTDNSYLREHYRHSYNYGISERKRLEIRTLNRIGQFRYNENEVLQAQKYFQRAVNKYEENRQILGNSSEYGSLYEDLGDIYYYKAGKYNEALIQFAKAYATGYRNDNLDYKIGFVNYKNRNYSKAAASFYDITLKERENESALLAFANASVNYGVYSPAKAYYDRVIEKIEYWKDHEKDFDLGRRRDQREILEKLMQVYNNQGVTLFKLAEKNRNQDYYSESLVFLSKSAELYDTLMRDPETMNKSLTKPLAQLNMKWILLNSGWKNRPGGYEKSVIPYSSENMRLDAPVIYNIIDQDLYGRVSQTLD